MPARAPLAVVLCLAAAAACPATAAPPGNAQSDAIVRALRPTDPSASGTRGIRIARPDRPADPSVSLNVDFATGSADLTPAAMHTLDALGQALGDQRLAGYHFRIEGHTDTVGTRPYNKALSQRRANAVADYLETKYQIDPARLRPVGMGEAGLLVATPDQTPDQRNRRVLVVNTGS